MEPVLIRSLRKLKIVRLKPQLFYRLLGLFLFLATALSPLQALAQTEQPSGPVYIVQEGDTLFLIAQRFGVSMADLQAANDIPNPNVLTVGTELVIPGLEGVNGVLTTRAVPFGENLRSLSRRYQVPADGLARLNRLTSPAELFAGADLIIPESSAATASGRRLAVAPGKSLLELAVEAGANPWSAVLSNHLQGTWEAVPGDVLWFAGGETQPGGEDGPGGETQPSGENQPGALPEAVSGVQIDPLPLVQGKTTVIRVDSSAELTLSGSLVNHELHFFRESPESYVSMQGIHALAEPGFYPLQLKGNLADGTPFGFSQLVYVQDGGYVYDPTLTVDPDTVDPANTKPEDKIWNALPVEATPERLWEGKFAYPAAKIFAGCYPSYFGNRRSYNGGPYNYFHTGLDICGGVGAEVFAPAPGTVVYTGTLTVRGNAIMLNHGWGVYSGYEHLSEILVKVGDQVETGQLIGRVGGTGRVTGSHLHWEIWAGGVQVDPLDWLEREFP